MKHLERFEDFAYHSEISEKTQKKDPPKERNNKEDEIYKCHKCIKRDTKPVYQNTLGEIPRLF